MRVQYGPDGSPPLEMILPNYLQFGRIKLPVSEMRAVLTQPAVMQSSNSTLSYHAVMAGMVAAFLPDWLVDDDLACGRLEPAYPAQTAQFYRFSGGATWRQATSDTAFDLTSLL